MKRDEVKFLIKTAISILTSEDISMKGMSGRFKTKPSNDTINNVVNVCGILTAILIIFFIPTMNNCRIEKMAIGIH